jgi:cytochrome c oxidase cbb3-type subunit 3
MSRVVARSYGPWRLLLLACVLSAPAHAQVPDALPSIGPRAQAGPPDRPPVDGVAADRGRVLYGVECITCHGSTARGTATAPSLIRSIVVLNDRYGSLLVPFFQKGHPLQSGRPSTSLTSSEAVDLMHFLRQRINDTLRGSPVFMVGDILVGNARAGRTYFEGEGGCTACHSTTGDLAGLATRVPAPVDVQQRMLFPLRRAGKSEVTAVVSRPGAPPLAGTLVQEDDFFVTVRDEAGLLRVVRKVAGVTTAVTDPLRFHREVLDRFTDKAIHDLVAYLVTLK